MKIADFGISKQAQEGGTDLRTHVGTSGYIAPEVMGFLAGNDPAVAYSVAIDIWATGVITVELLLKRLPFLNIYDLTSYINGSKELDLDSVAGVNLSNTCRDFVRKLLTPNPVARLTADSAVKHPWIYVGMTPIGTRES